MADRKPLTEKDWKCGLCPATGKAATYKERERLLGQHIRDAHPSESK